MIKRIGYILLAFFLIIIFIAPVRNYVNNLFQQNKVKSQEEQLIGKVSGYNPYVKELQDILKKAGFDPGSIDGRMGDKTRIAIKKFQKKKGLKPTGMIDAATQLAFNREKEAIKHSPKTETKINLYRDRSTSSTVKDKHLEVDNKDTSKKIKIQDEVLSYRLKSKNRTKQIQTALKKAGFYKGEIDGRTGPQTKEAIKAFQKSKGLNPDGAAGPKTWEELNKYLEN